MRRVSQGTLLTSSCTTNPYQDPKHVWQLHQAPGSGALPRLDEDEELADDATGLAGRLPLADFAEAGPASPPDAWQVLGG
jgi:hypothetical protein